MRAIYKRELKSYFCSMTGYVFIAFMTMFTVTPIFPIHLIPF